MLSKQAKKVSTEGSGILAQSAKGIGTNRLMRFVDNTIVAGRVSSIGIPVPLIGRIDLIDGLNYLVMAGGLKLNKKGIISVVAAKVEMGVLPLVPSLNVLPGIGSPTGSQTNNVTSTGADF